MRGSRASARAASAICEIAPGALVSCYRIVFAENRYPLFRTMLQEESDMAKGQKKSNKEARKPKKAVEKKIAANPSTKGILKS